MHPLQVFQSSASFPCNTTSDSLPIQVHSALYVFGQAAAVAQKRIMGRRNRIRSKAHGNSGIADGVQGDESIGSPEGQNPEMLVDPDWVDTDQPPDIGKKFCIFTPPRKFSDEMIGARSAWAYGVDRAVADAITYVTANVVVPHIWSLQVWRDHAADFFHRLCAHRKHAHAMIGEAIEELRKENVALNARICDLEARAADAEAGLAAAHTRFQYANSSGSQRGRDACSRERAISRERSIEERLLDAQLNAARGRSSTPSVAAARARQLMEAHLGHTLPDFDAAPHQD